MVPNIAEHLVMAARFALRVGTLRSRVRPAIATIVLLIAGLAAPTAAMASPGCTALHGSVSNFIWQGQISATGFAAGDVVTATISTAGWYNELAIVTVVSGVYTRVTATVSDVGTVSYTVPTTSDTLTLSISYSVTSETVMNWSCTAAPIVSAAASDSAKLAAVRVGLTPLIGTTSAQAMTGGIDQAIADAFSGRAAPVAAGPNGMTVNLNADPKRASADPWQMWASVVGTGWDGSSATGLNGRQANVTAGVGVKLTPDWVIGLVAGYEQFDYDIASLSGTLKGSGGSLGGYSGIQVLPSLRADASLIWSRIGYDAAAGSASGSYEGDRWIASAGLTGSLRWQQVTLEPSSRVFAVRERQEGFTDSLGTAQPDLAVTTGRVASGGRIIYPWAITPHWTLSPSLGAYADWRFGELETSSDTLVALADGWSGRITGGLTLLSGHGGLLVAFTGDVGGLGTGTRFGIGRLRANWPF